MIAEQRISSDGRMDDRTGPAAEEGAEAVPTWQAFEATLAAVLARMAVDTFLILSTRDDAGSPYYVQFAQGGRRGFRAEAVSNAYLEGQRALPSEQEERLWALGWQWPSPHGSEDRNFSRQWPMPVPFRVVAHLAVRTLREIFAVTLPSDLVYRRFDRDGRDFDEPDLGLQQLPGGSGSERRARPCPGGERCDQGSLVDGPAGLDAVAEAGVADFLQIDRVVRDPLGDIPIRVDDVRMIVRVLDGPSPALRIFSPVLEDVACDRALLEALNEANVRLRYARVLLVDDDVLVAAEVPGQLATPALVSLVCAEVCGIARAVGGDLGDRFGGHPGRRPTLLN